MGKLIRLEDVIFDITEICYATPTEYPNIILLGFKNGLEIEIMCKDYNVSKEFLLFIEMKSKE